MVLDYVGNGKVMVYAQLGQHSLARATETSSEPHLGGAAIPRLASWAIDRVLCGRYDHTSRGTTRG